MIDGGLARYLEPGDQTISARVTGHLFYKGGSGIVVWRGKACRGRGICRSRKHG